MQKEKLIEEVRKYPLLYDLRDPKYSDVHKKEKAWNEIAIVLSQPDMTSRVASAAKMRESSEILEQAENRSGAGGARGEAGGWGRRRRSAVQPLQELSNYYLKYKSWAGSNAAAGPLPHRADHDADGHFDVDNYLQLTNSSNGLQ